jgi:HEPN domain-containing protein
MSSVHFMTTRGGGSASAALATAGEFYSVAESCFSGQIHPSKSPVEFTVPGVVCAAFSIELGLKALLLHSSDRAPWGHDLSKLFDLLSSEIQVEIAIETEWPLPRFGERLSGISKAFEDWRYIHENNESLAMISVSYLQSASKAVFAVASRKIQK